MKSILVVEDHAVLAESIAHMLSQKGHYKVAAVASTAEEAVSLLSHLKVDLALVDVSLPRMDGIELVARLAAQYPRIRFLMLSAHDSRDYVERSLQAGARGYIVKDDLDGIITGVRCVLDGGTYLSQQISGV
ncbi:MAG: response regulator transcription factor [Bacteroidota bacterium]